MEYYKYLIITKCNGSDIKTNNVNMKEHGIFYEKSNTTVFIPYSNIEKLIEYK
jgi:hypothetical protein